MKSTVNKITESAKRRDTLGRNKVSVLDETELTGETLLRVQNNTSSDNIEKMTHVIITTSGKAKYLIKFRVLEIGNPFANANTTAEIGPVVEEEEGEDND